LVSHVEGKAQVEVTVAESVEQDIWGCQVEEVTGGRGTLINEEIRD
jgi:hypothetical protein